MPADAAETRFPPDKAERALWGLPPMSERERGLAENGAGPKGCRLSKSRSDPFEHVIHLFRLLLRGQQRRRA